MKKRIALISLMVVIFACVFALGVCAQDNVIKLDKLPTLEEINANPSEYVSHLDAFDTNSLYLEDSESVVVLCDQQETKTYFVFPAAYVINSTSYNVSFTALNNALSAADSTLFASYARNGGRGGSIYMIRIEVPTYVTRFGYDKFESCTELLEIYFPTHIVTNEETGESKEVTYFSEFTQADFFNGAKKLVTVHNMDKVPTKSLTNAFAANCQSLQNIKLPEGITSIPGSAFSGCSSLTYLEIPESVTSIGGSAFKGCGFVELTLPNSVTSIGKAAFSGCKNLVTFNFGESFKAFARVNQDYETFYNCDSLKYVYIPSSFLTAVSGAKAGDYKHIFNDIDSNVTFFFTGTEEEANQIVSLMASTNANPTLGNAFLEQYDKTKNYENYGDVKGSNMIIFGYNYCKAFYGDNHESSTSYGFDGEEYTSEYCRFDGCERCGDIIKTSYGKLLISKGYSCEAGGNGFSFGITFNKEAIKSYEEIEGTTLKYGFVAGKITEGDGGNIVDQNGDKATDSVFTSLFTSTEYELFTVKVTGIDTDANKAKDVYVSAFVIDGQEIYYVGDAVTSTAVAVSYDKIYANETKQD